MRCVFSRQILTATREYQVKSMDIFANPYSLDVFSTALHSPPPRAPSHRRRPRPRPLSTLEESNPRSTTSPSKTSLSLRPSPHSLSRPGPNLYVPPPLSPPQLHLQSPAPLPSNHHTLPCSPPFTPFSRPHSLLSLSYLSPRFTSLPLPPLYRSPISRSSCSADAVHPNSTPPFSSYNYPSKLCLDVLIHPPLSAH